MSYKKDQMVAAFNIALQSIFNRHQPPMGDVIEILLLAIVNSVNAFIPDEEKNECIDAIIEDLNKVKVTVH